VIIIEYFLEVFFNLFCQNFTELNFVSALRYHKSKREKTARKIYFWGGGGENRQRGWEAQTGEVHVD